MSSLPKNYWFKRRRYGLGWYPVTYQGWLAVAVYATVVLVLTFTVDSSQALPVVGFATLLLVRLCYAKGPKPRWRWGKSSSDDPNQDW
jgi:hypothetical protein